MCGFGDKVQSALSDLKNKAQNSFALQDRRPLAPAAVCRMVVKREDNSLVDDEYVPFLLPLVLRIDLDSCSEIDTSFFLVTVDLWSEDGTQEINLVQHPSSQERIINSYMPNPAKRRKGNGDSPPTTTALYGTRPGDPQVS